MDFFWLKKRCNKKLWKRLEVYLFDETSCERIHSRLQLPRRIEIKGNVAVGSGNVLKIHKRLVIKKSLKISYSNSFRSECVLNDSRSELNSKYPDGVRCIEKLAIRFAPGDGCKFHLGEGVMVGDANVFLGEGSRLFIGKECMLSWGVVVRMTDSHTVLDATTGEILNKQKSPCVIGDHSWIGLRSIIMKNAQIPNNTIVGAGSIVTSHFTEPHTAIAGIPARVVKTGVTWDRLKIFNYELENG